MNKSGDLGNPFGQLTSIAKTTVGQLVKEPFEDVEKAEEQAAAKRTESMEPSGDKKKADASDSTDIPSKEATLEIIKKIYEESDPKVKAPSDKTIEAAVEKNRKGAPEEIQKKLAADEQFKQHLHETRYYEPTFNPQKKAQEERPAEKIAREEGEKEKKKMEELKLEEKKKEELSPAIKQGTHEVNPGVSG